MKLRDTVLWLNLFCLFGILLIPNVSSGRDFVLTVGGGYSPEGNQVSLEKNVLLFQGVLNSHPVKPTRNDIYFSDGKDNAKDVLVHDLESVPEPNRLMAAIFGSTDSLGLSFRDHRIANVRDASIPANIRAWFREVSPEMHEGDRLVIYVTAHGHRSRESRNAYNTSIAMWEQSALPMQEFANLLDGMDADVDVIMVMVQCYTGGFSHLIYKGGDPKNGLSPQSRVGFYATVHDRPAAGCTPEVNEANYKEYSTYFLAAFLGNDRTGNEIELPDYDRDGRVSLEEAHAYTVLKANTIDLPVKTSGEFLRVESRFGKDDDGLLRDDEPFEVVLSLASPVQRVLLNELSKKLNLTGESRLVDAWRQSRSDRRRRRSSRGGNVRSKIASDLLKKWPELKNPFNPLVTEMLTSRSDEFINEVQSHPDYQRIRTQIEQETSGTDQAVTKVQYERFLRVADNVILAENLVRMNDAAKIQEYETIVTAEAGSLFQQ